MNGKAVKGVLSVPSNRDVRRRCGATNGNIACYEEAENSYLAVVTADTQANALLSLRDTKKVDEGAATVVLVNLYTLSDAEKIGLPSSKKDVSSAAAVQLSAPPLMLLLRIPVLFSTHRDRVCVAQERLPYIEKILFAGKKSIVIMNDLGDLVCVPTGLSFSYSGEERSDSGSNESNYYGAEEDAQQQPFASVCVFEYVLDFDTSFTRPVIADVEEVAMVCAARTGGVSVALLLNARSKPAPQMELSDALSVPDGASLVSCEWMPHDQSVNRRLSALIVTSAADGCVKVYLLTFSLSNKDDAAKLFVVAEQKITLIRELLQGPQTACMSIASMYCEARQEVVCVALGAEQKSVGGARAAETSEFSLKGKDGRVFCVQSGREGDRKDQTDKDSVSTFAPHSSLSVTGPSLLAHLERPSFASPSTTPFLLILTVPCALPPSDDKLGGDLRHACTFRVHRFTETDEKHMKTVVFSAGNPALGTFLSYAPSDGDYIVSLFSSNIVLTYALPVPPSFATTSNNQTRVVKRLFEVMKHMYVVGAWQTNLSSHDEEGGHRCLICRGVYTQDAGAVEKSTVPEAAHAIVGQLEIIQVSNMSVYTAADTPVEENPTATLVSSPMASSVKGELKNCLRELLQDEMAKMEARLQHRLDTLESKLNLLVAWNDARGT